MKSMLVAGSLLLALSVGIGATANHEVGHPGPPFCYGTVTEVPTPAGTLYVEDRGGFVDEDAEGIWIYLETNGVAGLQRGGQSAVLGTADPEICIDAGTPDTLIL